MRILPESADRIDWPRLVAQVVNDIVRRLTPAFATMYMQANATATVIATAATPVKIAGATTAGATNAQFDHASNRLTFKGSRPKYFSVSVVGVLENGGTGDAYGIYVYRNGAKVDESEKFITANASGRVASFSTQAIVELASGDYVEVWLENLADTDDATISYLNVILTPIP